MVGDGVATVILLANRQRPAACWALHIVFFFRHQRASYLANLDPGRTEAGVSLRAAARLVYLQRPRGVSVADPTDRCTAEKAQNKKNHCACPFERKFTSALPVCPIAGGALDRTRHICAICWPPGLLLLSPCSPSVLAREIKYNHDPRRNELETSFVGLEDALPLSASFCQSANLPSCSL
ncbi:hypothetical protein VTN02DRAFT_5060 [Thermoascus thermophilus]